jgi:hypothetical protein
MKKVQTVVADIVAVAAALMVSKEAWRYRLRDLRLK